MAEEVVFPYSILYPVMKKNRWGKPMINGMTIDLKITTMISILERAIKAIEIEAQVETEAEIGTGTETETESGVGTETAIEIELVTGITELEAGIEAEAGIGIDTLEKRAIAVKILIKTQTVMGITKEVWEGREIAINMTMRSTIGNIATEVMTETTTETGTGREIKIEVPARITGEAEKEKPKAVREQTTMLTTRKRHRFV